MCGVSATGAAKPAVVKRAFNAATIQLAKESLVNIPITCILSAVRHCVQALCVRKEAALLKYEDKKTTKST